MLTVVQPSVHTAIQVHRFGVPCCLHLQSGPLTLRKGYYRKNGGSWFFPWANLHGGTWRKSRKVINRRRCKSVRSDTTNPEAALGSNWPQRNTSYLTLCLVVHSLQIAPFKSTKECCTPLCINGVMNTDSVHTKHTQTDDYVQHCLPQHCSGMCSAISHR